MKFLLIASYLPSVMNFRSALIASIKAAGFEVHIAAPQVCMYSEELDKLTKLGYVVHSLDMESTGTNPLADGRTLIGLFKLMKKIKPDYMMGYTIKPVIYGLLAAKLASVPNRFALITGLGYTFQGVDSQSHKKSRLQNVVHKLYSLALSSAHKVFFQNPDDDALFKSLCILKTNALTKVVNGSGVDLSEYAIEPFPSEANVPVPRFLLIARLLGDKGVREYAKAARVIRSKYSDVQFDLVGWIYDNPDAIHSSELESWLDEGLFNYWGKLDDVRPAIAACSIYVLPSYREGTPRTVLEAMAMGRPIITTDAPGCRETVVEGNNGYLVSIKSIDDLVNAMEKFIMNPNSIIDMGLASRKLAESKFDVQAVNKVMLKEMGICPL